MVELLMSSRISRGFSRQFVAVFAFVCVIGAALPSMAATTAFDSACDPAFLERMQERAWGEAQREMMTNRQMVWKPDSVLALGCYNNWISAMGIIFSRDGGTGLNSIRNQATTYLSSAFNHTLGGGNLAGANNSNCANIRNLWQQAECNTNLNLTQIQSLRDASTSDPRVKPTACGSPGLFWGNTANVIVQPGANAPFDAMNLFTSVVAPKSEAGSCFAGIKTGVQVSGGNPEIVCSNPGCVPSGGGSPTCN